MKLLAALLCVLALMGCTMHTTPAQSSIPARLAPTKETENDTLRCCPLDSAECRFFVADGELWMQQGQVLRCYQGKNLTVTKELRTKGTLLSVGKRILFWEEESRNAILLERSTTAGRIIPLPDALAPPLLCPEGNHLYYAAPDRLMVTDTNTGIHRPLREGDACIPTEILESGGILVCRNEEESLYIACMDGSLLGASGPVITGASLGSRDCAAIRCGNTDCLYLGSTLMPLTPQRHFICFLPNVNGVLVATEGDGHSLAIYDLNTGSCTASLPLGALATPEQAAMLEDGRVLFQPAGEAALYIWQPETEIRRENKLPITPLCTQEAPDQLGLTHCRQRAGFLRQQYGLDVRLHKDAIPIQPPGYTLTPEHLAAILLDALDSAEHALTRLNAEFVRQTFGSSTHLCLVRSIRTPDGRSVDSLHYAVGMDTYLFLVPSPDLEENLLRLLGPMLDDHILPNSSALDFWESLAPIDCSPTEDRAAIFLAAISPSSRGLFTSAIAQRKLRLLCTGIRETYNLTGSTQFVWEQYLW